MEASLKKFMKTGTLGDVQCGLSRIDVAAMFGKPDGWLGIPGTLGTPAPVGSALSWNYGDLAFRFRDRGEKLTSITLNLDGGFKNSHIEIIDFDFDVKTTQKDLLEWMDFNGIKYQSSPDGMPPVYLSEGDVEIVGKPYIYEIAYDDQMLARQPNKEAVALISKAKNKT